MLAGHHLNENGQEVPLPIFTLPADTMIECKAYPDHGKFDPHAYYTESEIAVMLVEQGFIDCPFCLDMICDN